MMNNKLKEIEQFIISPFGILSSGVILVLVLIRFVLFPWLDWRESTYAYVSQQKSNLRSISVLQQANKNIETNSVDLAKAELVVKQWLFELKDEQLEIELQKLIERYVSDYELELSSWNTGSSVDGGGLSETRMTLRGTGSLSGIEQFIFGLEVHDKLIRIPFFEIDKRFSSGEDELKFEVIVQVYSASNG